MIVYRGSEDILLFLRTTLDFLIQESTLEAAIYNYGAVRLFRRFSRGVNVGYFEEKRLNADNLDIFKCSKPSMLYSALESQ